MQTYLTKALDLGKPIGIVFTILVVLYAFMSHASADNTVGDLVEQKALLSLRIDQTKAEYERVGTEKAIVQETCNLLAAKESQMKQLAELNGARRKEIEAIDQRLSTMQSLTQHQ